MRERDLARQNMELIKTLTYYYASLHFPQLNSPRPKTGYQIKSKEEMCVETSNSFLLYKIPSSIIE
jgi:hypothetical protein